MTFKMEVDNYFNRHYKQLVLTTTKIINKNGCKYIIPTDLVNLSYIYALSQEKDIINFSKDNDKTIEHIIYVWVLRFINQETGLSNTYIKREYNKLSRVLSIIDMPEYDYPKYNTNQKDEFYSDDFIKGFHHSLKRLDRNCFNLYYYEGLKQADLAKHLDISISSVYSIINNIKRQFKEYVNSKKIYN